MKVLYILVAVTLAACASNTTANRTEQPRDVAEVKPTVPPSEEFEGGESANLGDDQVEAEAEESAQSQVECHIGGQIVRPNATPRGDEYFNVQEGKPCDVLIVHAEYAHTIHRSLHSLEEAQKMMGEANVRLRIGTEAKVYHSKEELLSDPEAGADAVAVLPRDFDFEAAAVARYTLLHSAQTSCRDEFLRLSGDEAEALRDARKEWGERARELADQWRFVPDAAEPVRGVHVIDPVLPSERRYPGGGSCTVSWVEQPALTPVPHGTETRVYYRVGGKPLRRAPQR